MNSFTTQSYEAMMLAFFRNLSCCPDRDAVVWKYAVVLLSNA